MKKASSILLLLLCFSSLSFADGMYVSDAVIHMYQPNQKAIIGWDGKTETMLLVSAVKADDIANFAWIIPIRSSVKPEVEAGDISIFQDLVDYVYGPVSTALGSGRSAFVEVVGFKEIDVYDITILRSTSSKDLIDWLKTNGYSFPEDARPVLDEYTAEKDCYFVVNKIDLKNRFAKEIDEINAIYATRRERYDAFMDDVSKAMAGLGATDFNKDESLFSIYTYVNRRLDEELKKEGMSRYIEVDLGNGLKIKGELAVDIYFPRRDTAGLPAGGILAFWYGVSSGRLRIGNEKAALVGYDPNLSATQYGFSGTEDPSDVVRNLKTSFDRTRRSLADKDKALIEEFFSLNGAAFAAFEKEMNRRRKVFTDKVEPLVQEIRGKVSAPLGGAIKLDQFLAYPATSLEGKVSGLFSMSRTLGDAADCEKKYGKLRETIVKLMDGVGTPLKFRFQPAEAYYPLEISAAGEGRTIVDVYYVSAESTVKDASGTLSFTRAKKPDQAIGYKLKKALGLDKIDYITMLSYQGDAKNLKSDAVFRPYGKFGDAVDLENILKGIREASTTESELETKLGMPDQAQEITPVFIEEMKKLSVLYAAQRNSRKALDEFYEALDAAIRKYSAKFVWLCSSNKLPADSLADGDVYYFYSLPYNLELIAIIGKNKIVKKILYGQNPRMDK